MRQQQQQTTTTTSFHRSVSLFVRDISSEDFMWAAEGAAHAGAAKRRRERRHRAHLKYVRMSVAMALSECKHHTSRDQRMDRDGEWERAVPHGHVPEHPIPHAAGTEYFSLDVEDVPAAGSRPDFLAGVRPQERVQQHPVDQIVDTAPALPILDVPVPLVGNSWWTSSVSSIRCVLLPSRLSTCPRSLWRSLCREPQLVEQLVEVPTILYFLNQKVDFPVPGGGGRHADLQGCLRGQSSTAPQFSEQRISKRIVEQNVGILGVYAQYRVQQRLRHPQFLALQLIGSTLRIRRFNGFFALFLYPIKVRRSPGTRVRECLGAPSRLLR